MCARLDLCICAPVQACIHVRAAVCPCAHPWLAVGVLMCACVRVCSCSLEDDIEDEYDYDSDFGESNKTTSPRIKAGGRGDVTTDGDITEEDYEEDIASSADAAGTSSSSASKLSHKPPRRHAQPRPPPGESDYEDEEFLEEELEEDIGKRNRQAVAASSSGGEGGANTFTLLQKSRNSSFYRPPRYGKGTKLLQSSSSSATRTTRPVPPSTDRPQSTGRSNGSRVTMPLIQQADRSGTDEGEGAPTTRSQPVTARDRAARELELASRAEWNSRWSKKEVAWQEMPTHTLRDAPRVKPPPPVLLPNSFTGKQQVKQLEMKLKSQLGVIQQQLQQIQELQNPSLPPLPTPSQPDEQEEEAEAAREKKKEEEQRRRAQVLRRLERARARRLKQEKEEKKREEEERARRKAEREESRQRHGNYVMDSRRKARKMLLETKLQEQRQAEEERRKAEEAMIRAVKAREYEEQHRKQRFHEFEERVKRAAAASKRSPTAGDKDKDKDEEKAKSKKEEVPPEDVGGSHRRTSRKPPLPTQQGKWRRQRPQGEGADASGRESVARGGAVRVAAKREAITVQQLETILSDAIESKFTRVMEDTKKTLEGASVCVRCVRECMYACGFVYMCATLCMGCSFVGADRESRWVYACMIFVACVNVCMWMCG